MTLFDFGSHHRSTTAEAEDRRRPYPAALQPLVRDMVANGVLGPRPGERVGETATLWLDKMSAAAWLAARRLRNRGPRNGQGRYRARRREVEEFPVKSKEQSSEV